MVIDAPITADCLGPLTLIAGGTDATGAIGVGAGLRIGSLEGLAVAISSFRLFHT
jgi:hypothetical protein